MGTSTPYGGPSGGTPLVPSWLGDGDTQVPPAAAPVDGASNANPPAAGETVPTPPNRPAIPAAADPSRFTAARGNLTRFASSGGTDRASLGRAVSQYVSSSAGGARQAGRRMGASRSSGARLLGFLTDVQTRGLQAALQSLNLGALANQPITEVFLGIADYICPGSSTIDEGIAREAYIETIVELVDEGITDLSTLNAEQLSTVFELFATHAIEARLCNDIGAKTVSMPANAETALLVEKQLRDFIRGSVNDALTLALAESPNLTHDTVSSFVDAVYESAFSILKALGDAEAEQ